MSWARDLAPLGALVVALLASAAACNLYGNDGTALWLTVVGEREDTVRADVRGRQLALVLLVVAPALALALGYSFAVGSWRYWPAVLALVPALLGAGAGVALLLSVVGVSHGVDPRARVEPTDDHGDLGMQQELAYWVTAALALPTIVAVAVGLSQSSAVWWPVAVGLVNGALWYWWLGRTAVGYLQDRLPTVFGRIRYRRLEEADDDRGVLARYARSSQQVEDEARATRG